MANTIFSDVNMRFRSPGAVVKDIQVKDVESVFQSVDTILDVTPGEALFLPEFGSRISDFLFEPITDATANGILTEIMRAVERWDPRVRVLWSKSQVIPDPDNNQFAVALALEIRGLSDVYNYQGRLTQHVAL